MYFPLTKIRRRSLLWLSLVFCFGALTLGWFINRWMEQRAAKRIIPAKSPTSPLWHAQGSVIQ